jgi:hypothetical protein
MTRIGQLKDSDEILKHAFFADVDLRNLQAKKLKSPYLPSVTDLEKLRTQQENLVSFQDFQETIIPKQGMELVNCKKDEFEFAFGQILDDDDNNNNKKENIIIKQ